MQKKSGKLQGVIVKSPGNPEGSTQIVFKKKNSRLRLISITDWIKNGKNQSWN